MSSPPEETTTTTAGRRRIRFAETHQMHEFETEELQNKDELWLSKESCHRNKERCMRAGRLWKRKGIDILLNDSYEKPARGTQARINAYVDIQPDDQDNHIIGDIPRGIERFINSKHAEERRYAKVHCIESVVDFYTYMRRQNKSLQEIEQELYELSVTKSKKSRDFARRCGHADSLSVNAAQQQVVQTPPPPTTTRKEHANDDDEVSVISAVSVVSVSSVVSTASRVRKGLSTKAMKSTRRLTRMITGNSYRGSSFRVQRQAER